jgi:hypothetical protein
VRLADNSNPLVLWARLICFMALQRITRLPRRQGFAEVPEHLEPSGGLQRLAFGA